MIISIVAVVILLMLSAFFSGSETALTGASQAFVIDQEKNAHNPRAKLLNRLFQKRDNLIITTLVGSNLSNTLATSLSTSVLISLFGREGVAYATIIMTFLVLVYTDMLPKSYAVRNANKMALLVASPINFFVRLFSPAVWFLQFIVNYTFKLAGANKNSSSATDSLAEVRGAIYMYDGNDALQEKAMLKSILDLTDIHVYDVMNHRRNLFSLDIDLPVEEILNRVKNCPFSRIPLYKNRPENIVGVIRIKTLLKEAVEHHNNYENIKIEEIMTKPWFIPDNTTLMQQLQLFRARREHFAIVVDEYGVLQGIVTLEDILEEIVGDINDESDISNLDIMGIRKINDSCFIVDGQVPIRDLNRKYGWNISDDNAVTIAGYLMDMTRSIPSEGQKFIFDDFQYEILKRNKNQLSLIKITRQEKTRTEK